MQVTDMEICKRMNIDELSEHLGVSRRTVYNYREQVDKLIARSSFERVRGMQVLCSQYLPLYEICAKGEALPVQWSEEVSEVSYANSGQVQSTHIQSVPVEVMTDEATSAIVKARVISMPEIPDALPIVYVQTDMRAVEAHGQGMGTRIQQVKGALLNGVQSELDSLGAEIEARTVQTVVDAQYRGMKKAHDILNPNSPPNSPTHQSFEE